MGVAQCSGILANASPASLLQPDAIEPGDSLSGDACGSTDSGIRKPVASGTDHTSLVEVRAEDSDIDRLSQTLRNQVSRSDDAETFANTIVTVADLLADGIGGMIVVVLHSHLWTTGQRLAIDTLDGGLHTDIFRKLIRNIHDQRDVFKNLLSALTAHSASDRWEHDGIEDLASSFPEAADLVGKLEGQPKDGAILLDHEGGIRGVCCHLKYQSARFQLVKHNGKSAGTRHASALGMAEWLGSSDPRFPGVVFARSDGGGGHAFLPRNIEPRAPLILHFKTWMVPTQEDMLRMFKEKITMHGRVMRKDQPALIRPGRKGEHVVTVVNGRKTSEIVIEDDSSVVVRASTVDQEHYVLNNEKFLRSWEAIGSDLEHLHNYHLSDKFLQSQCKQLMARGFRLHKPNRRMKRFVYQLEEHDMRLLPTSSFVSGWGATQPVKAGDFLAMPAPQADEIYLMPAATISAYVECGLNDDAETIEKMEAASPNTGDGLTQEEMIERFQERIQLQGRLMTKSTPTPIRPGKKGERVTTCVNGRVTAELVIQDDTSMVVRAPIHQELYVLPRNVFEDNYLLPGRQVEGDGSLQKLLRSTNFKLYTPKPVEKYVYQLTKKDMEDLPRGCFYARWGSLQQVSVGDHIAMPALKDGGDSTEIYFISDELLNDYTEVAKISERRARTGK
jgi:hypothetical protein